MIVNDIDNKFYILLEQNSLLESRLCVLLFYSCSYWDLVGADLQHRPLMDYVHTLREFIHTMPLAEIEQNFKCCNENLEKK